jgi:hypothetical protein
MDSVYTIGKIVIQWNMILPRSFRVQTSMDDTQWDTIYCIKQGSNFKDTVWFTGKEAKYVKMQGYDNMEYSIKEIEIYFSDGKEYEPVLCSVGIEEHSMKVKGLKVYPNPAIDELILEFHLEQRVSNNIKIVDISGKVVYSTLINPGMQIVNIDLSGLGKGVYFIHISGEKNKRVEKFVKY